MSLAGTKIVAAAGAALVLAMSAGGAIAAPGEATASVNVRAGPGTGYAVLDVLYPGEPVDIRQCRGNWCFVSHSGPDGWVSASYLEQTGYQRPPIYIQPPTIIIRPPHHHPTPPPHPPHPPHPPIGPVHPIGPVKPPVFYPPVNPPPHPVHPIGPIKPPGANPPPPPNVCTIKPYLPQCHGGLQKP